MGPRWRHGYRVAGDDCGNEQCRWPCDGLLMVGQSCSVPDDQAQTHDSWRC
jgi:hypothetical protein